MILSYIFLIPVISLESVKGFLKLVFCQLFYSKICSDGNGCFLIF